MPGGNSFLYPANTLLRYFEIGGKGAMPDPTARERSALSFPLAVPHAYLGVAW